MELLKKLIELVIIEEHQEEYRNLLGDIHHEFNTEFGFNNKMLKDQIEVSLSGSKEFKALFNIKFYNDFDFVQIFDNSELYLLYIQSNNQRTYQHEINVLAKMRNHIPLYDFRNTNYDRVELISRLFAKMIIDRVYNYDICITCGTKNLSCISQNIKYDQGNPSSFDSITCITCLNNNMAPNRQIFNIDDSTSLDSIVTTLGEIDNELMAYMGRSQKFCVMEDFLI